MIPFQPGQCRKADAAVFDLDSRYQELEKR